MPNNTSTTSSSNLSYSKDGLSFALQYPDFSGGVNDNFDPLTLRYNESIFAVNNDLNYERDLSSRTGYTLLGADGSAGKPWMAGVLNQDIAADIHIRIINAVTGVKLQKYSGGTWNDIGAAFGTNADRVPFSMTNVVINDVNYVYFTNGVTTLRRTDGASYSTITNSATDIICKYICTIQNILVLGNFTATHPSNRVIWAVPGTDQFYRSGETYSTTSNKADFSGPLSQIISPNLWDNLVYVFTQGDGVWYVNPFKATTGAVSDINCISPRSVAYGENRLVWFDSKGRVRVYRGSGNPTRISKKVEPIIRAMNAANIPNVCCGITNGKIRIWIGDITDLFGVTGLNYSNVELEYDIDRSETRQVDIWRVRTNIPAYQYYNQSSYTGFERQYIASNAKESILIRDTSEQDNGVDINVEYWTPDQLLAGPKNRAVPRELYIKYAPNNAVNDQIAIDYAVDGAKQYTTWIPDGNSQKLTMIDPIDPVSGDPISTRYVEKMVLFPEGIRCKSLSLKIGSSSKITIYEIRVTGILEADDSIPQTF